MKLLLTSGGIQNDSIRNALVDLLGKPISESSALYIPTALHTKPFGAEFIWRQVHGLLPSHLCDLGWKSLGLLELTALSSVDWDWAALVRETDALLVEGGDALYLSHWMRESGLATLLPSLTDTVYVGMSAGSMAMTPAIGDVFVQWRPPAGGDRALGLIDFTVFPHLDMAPDINTMDDAQEWSATVPMPAYAIDDQTAIKVTDGAVEVVSEGHWKQFTR